MKIKRTISFLISAVCAASAFSGMTLAVGAASYSEGLIYGDMTYIQVDEDDDGAYDYIEITDCDTSVTEVEIPAEIDGLPVTSVGDYAVDNCHSLVSVTISDSVTSIEGYAFFNCNSLESVTIGNSVTSIGESAFHYCYSLESITLPDSVTSICIYAFYECNSLRSITIENPECEIFGGITTISDSFVFDEASSTYGPSYSGTIYGYTNSSAQAYAEKYERTFKAIGDTNEDSEITVADVVLIQQALTNKSDNAELDSILADVNVDNNFNVFDVITLRQMILNS